MISNNTQRRRNEIEEGAASLRRRFTSNELRNFFIGRQHDSLFEYIGRLAIDRPAPDHIYVWEAFSIAVANKYTETILPSDS